MGTTLKKDLGFATALTTTIVSAVTIALVHTCQPHAVPPPTSYCPKILLVNAVPARFMPMTMMTGPTTMGGNSFLTRCTPTSLIMPARITYTSPAHTSASMTASDRTLYSSVPAVAPFITSSSAGRNAKDEPRNTGTLRFVQK